MYRLKIFSDYFSLNEAESTGSEDTSFIKDAFKQGLVKTIQGAFSRFGNEGTEGDFDKASEYQVQPYKGCGASAPYGVKSIPEMDLGLNKSNQIALGKARTIAALKVLNDKGRGDYKRALEDIKNGKSVLIGIRRKLEERKKNDDLFCDYIGFLGPKETDKDKQTILFPGTTCPSLAYFGPKPLNEKGTGIKAPGDTLYILKEWKPASEKIPAYKALVEGESVQVYRYPKGINSYEKAGTYKPGSVMKENVGMQIHRSSTGNTEGICVGPWSAGCQVLGKGSDFSSLISMCEGTGQDKFIYALFQEDDYLEFKEEIEKVKKQIEGENTSRQIASKETKPATGAKTSKEEKKS